MNDDRNTGAAGEPAPMSGKAASASAADIFEAPESIGAVVWTLWDAGHLVSLYESEQDACDAREALLDGLAGSDDDESCAQAIEVLPVRIERA